MANERPITTNDLNLLLEDLEDTDKGVIINIYLVDEGEYVELPCDFARVQDNRLVLTGIL